MLWILWIVINRNDWGDVDPEDATMNDHAVDNGERTYAVYALGTDRIWTTTELDRSVTIILLQEDYRPKR